MALKIHKIIWPEQRVEHIGRHRVTPEEVEEVCFGNPLVRRAKSEGENPVYYVLRQTEAGRYLFCVVIGFPDGNGYPVTARAMTSKERNAATENGKSDEEVQTPENRFDPGAGRILGHPRLD